MIGDVCAMWKIKDPVFRLPSSVFCLSSRVRLTRTVIGLYSDRQVNMRAIRVSEDIVPVSEFKAQAAECLRRVTATGQPIIITQNGKAAGVLLSPAEFDRLSERARFVAAVQEGLADADAGLLRDHDEVAERMRARSNAKQSG